MISDPNQKTAYFFEIMWFMIDRFFPPIQVVIADNDKKMDYSKNQMSHY